MKKVLIFLLTIITFFACSDSTSSDNGKNDEKDYSIISNLPWVTNEQECALVIIDKNSNIKKIGTGLLRPSDFSFSANGSLVVYRSIRSDNQQPVIVISDVDNLNDTYLSMEYATHPKISPDGKYIAFLQNNYNDQDSSGLFIMDTDGSNNYKLIDKYDLNGLQNWDWSSDSKGINYEVYTSGYTTYFIDKDGNNDPVEIDPIWIHITSIDDKTYYSLDGFQRAGLPEDAIMDSVGFFYYQIDNLGEKAWTVLNYVKSLRPTVVNFYLLGYDFNAKTERFLVDTTITSNNMKAYWSPDYNDIAVITKEGLFVAQIDGSHQKVLDYSIGNIYTDLVLKWIIRRD
ncbi:MAG: hypothetical protein P8X42_05475 [Calditrichaceae bacterium]|jgi:hypothetical protein